jgi:hypothetical protein
VSDDLFDAPGGGELFDWDAHNRRLLLITPKSIEASVRTVHGEKDAVRADIVVLGEPGAGPDEVLRETLIFPGYIQGQVRAHIGTGRMTLGRLGQGEATRGQKPPWLLSDPTDADKTVARAYLAQRDKPGPMRAPTSQQSSSSSLPPF